jgi:hypothetical protein
LRSWLREEIPAPIHFPNSWNQSGRGTTDASAALSFFEGEDWVAQLGNTPDCGLLPNT